MSGGRFDYTEHHIRDIAESIQEEIDNNNIPFDGIFPEQISEDWNGERYSKKTISEFKKGIECLRKAYIYAKRIDYLLEGDDDEESFHSRLKEDLKNFKFEPPIW